MDILEEIIIEKKKEVKRCKSLCSIKELEQREYFLHPVVPLTHKLKSKANSGVIAEFKRRSPSLGWINKGASVQTIATGYVSAGATALSILTDNHFFGGSNQDLTTARNIVQCPILRKDFIIDEYQVVETKSLGADVILLIAAALLPNKIKTLCSLAQSLGLEVLVEIHNKEELNRNLECGADIIGVNNRNLKTFEQSISLSQQLSSSIPNSFVKISESGIEHHESIIELKKYGYNGFLIGQTFMKNENPEIAALDFISQI